MKSIKRLLIFIFIILVLFVVCASIYVKYYGKGLLVKTLQSSLNRNVEIENVSYRFPLHLRMQNIRIAHTDEEKKFFNAQDIVARISLESILKRHLIFRLVKLTKPSIVMDKTDPADNSQQEPQRRYGVVVPPQEKNQASGDNLSEVQQGRDKVNQNKVTIEQLVLKQGRFQYANRSINKDFSFAMEDVYIKADNIIFPTQSEQISFKISGHLIKEGNPLSGSSVESRGWVDIVQRNMKASVEVIEADGSVGMSAEAVSKNNDMTVSGEIKFQNLLMGAKINDSPDASTVNNLISSALSAGGIKIGAQFSFKTKMDNFNPEEISFSGKVLTE